LFDFEFFPETIKTIKAIKKKIQQGAVSKEE
jgi:hypothetical protein